MRILIDMQGAQSESRYRGIGRYTLSLVEGMIRNAGDHEILLLVNEALVEGRYLVHQKLGSLLPQDRFIDWSAPARTRALLADNVWRNRAGEILRTAHVRGFEPDVVVVTSLFEGFVDDAVTADVPQVPTVIVLYDLIPLMQPELYLDNQPDYARFYHRKLDQLQVSRGWLSISEYSAREAIARLDLPEDRVVNISTACDALFSPEEETAAVRQETLETFQIEGDFILYTGGTDPRKNLPRLIDAYGGLPESIQRRYQLVFAGRMNATDRGALLALAQNRGIRSDRLVFTGYIQDEDLVRLYRLSTVFVFPSLHEGFGLPVLEAIACGTAVIASNASSIPEVLGMEAACFDPKETDAIRDLLEKVLTDATFREGLKLEQAKRCPLFSWDLTGRRAIEALESWVCSDRSHIEPGGDGWATTQKRLQRIEEEAVRALQSIDVSVAPSRADLREVAQCMATNGNRVESFFRRGALPSPLTWRIEGPFDSSYSLALVNREIARGLQRQGVQVQLLSREGHGTFEPDPAFLAMHPDVASMAEDRVYDPDIVSRFLYPPTVSAMSGRWNFLHGYCWEETGFPFEWVQSFNEELQGVFVASEHVRKILIDNGVSVPIAVTGLGADHFEAIVPDEAFKTPGKAFKFLHVSSCFPRKGADVLLRAFGETFGADDDVTLIIKTFPNPHNRIHEWLEAARAHQAHYPDVVILEDDLSDQALKSLYQGCDALVAPSRAEGFGLPMAEAMLAGLPVITVAWSGQADFCRDETTWCVDYEFGAAESHLDVCDSIWAEPRANDLGEKMREVFDASPEARAQRTEAARSLVLEQLTWDAVARRMMTAARDWAPKVGDALDLRMGWVTTWNTRCGIATYSQHLLEGLAEPFRVFAPYADRLEAEDEGYVERCWNAGETDDLEGLENALDRADIRTLVIQFNYGFFKLETLAAFIDRQLARHRMVVVTLHATRDPVHAPHKQLALLAPVLVRCDRVLVHAVDDLNRLKALGVIGNVAVLPHGLLATQAVARSSKSDEFTLASYGFFLPQKGLLALIEAVKRLREEGKRVRLIMVNAEYPAEVSRALIQQAKESIAAWGLQNSVTLHSDFLPDEDSLALLREADLIVFPYQETGESASGAVRYGIASGRPVAVTDLPIFADVREAVFTLGDSDPESLAAGLSALMDQLQSGAPETLAKQQQMDHWREAHRYPLISQRLVGMLKGLLRLH
jgi:O-antigen biosynthesis alpha-1,2-mannosyltransferase